MRKYFLFIVFEIFIFLSAFCQYSDELRDEIRKADSLKIENLKKQLPSLTGIVLVDSLNSLAQKYGDINGSGGFVHRFDSNYKYSSLANEEAQKIKRVLRISDDA